MQIVAVKTETASDDPEKTDQSHVLSHYLSGECKLGKSQENSFEKCLIRRNAALIVWVVPTLMFHRKNVIIGFYSVMLL